MIYTEKERMLPQVSYWGNNYPYIHSYMSNCVESLDIAFKLQNNKHWIRGMYISNCIHADHPVICKKISTIPSLLSYGISNEGDIFNLYTRRVYRNGNRQLLKTANSNILSQIKAYPIEGPYHHLVILRDINRDEIQIDVVELTFREFFGYDIYDPYKDDFEQYLKEEYENDSFDFSSVGLYLVPVLDRLTYGNEYFFDEPDIDSYCN